MMSTTVLRVVRCDDGVTARGSCGGGVEVEGAAGRSGRADAGVDVEADDEDAQSFWAFTSDRGVRSHIILGAGAARARRTIWKP